MLFFFFLRHAFLRTHWSFSGWGALGKAVPFVRSWCPRKVVLSVTVLSCFPF